MASTTFSPAPHFMSNSIVSMTNNIWDVELYASSIEPEGFRLRFDNADGKWAIGTLDGAHIKVNPSKGHDITLPKYVQEFAARMWRDNVS